MRDASWLDWPFFEERHRVLAHEVDAWCERSLGEVDHHDADAACRKLVKAMGEAGWLRYAVAGGPGGAWGGALPEVDSRSVCILRETLARHEGLADFAFAMQGLGSGAISLMGSDALRARYLPRVARGEAIAAFALSEPEAGSDVAALACEARLDGDAYVLNGAKTWISNGGIADFYCVFARTGEAPGARGINAFVVDADTGLRGQRAHRPDRPAPAGHDHFRQLPHPRRAALGEPGQGFKLAMMTLDIFRASVAAAALASPVARWTRGWNGPGRAACSARPWPTCS